MDMIMDDMVVDMVTTDTKAQARSLADFAMANGASKATILRLSDCFMVIIYA